MTTGEVSSAPEEPAAALDAGEALLAGGVLRVDADGALEALDRLLAAALPFVGDAAPGPGFGVLVVHVERGVEILDRLVELVCGDKALAAGGVWRRNERIAVDGSVEVEDRLAVVVLALVEETARMKRLGRFRRQADRDRQVAEGLLVATLGASRLPRPI